jgi:hypothetical protein
MRAEAIDYRYSESEQRQYVDSDQRESLLTPARRAGLEALEREFNEFLKQRRPSTGAP